MGERPAEAPEAALAPAVLLVDDDPDVLRFYRDVLADRGFRLFQAEDGALATRLIVERPFDLVIADIAMPNMDGIALLRAIRQVDLDVPVVMVTGNPSYETAVNAIEYGAFRYLTKPVAPALLRRVAEYAVVMNRMAKAKREALRAVSGMNGSAGDRAGLEASFERALAGAWMAYQPIVSYSERRVIGYEALARTEDATLSSPLLLIEAAEKLGRLVELGRRLRGLVAASMDAVPAEAKIFINVHPRDFDDGDLSSPTAPLARSASRVVLEVTERASLEAIADVPHHVQTLRSMGYRIAIDDLGAGHAGLNTFARLEPDVAKLDMGLVRNVDSDSTKQKVVRSMASLCRELGILVVTEGVETVGERDALLKAGCDTQQGFLFGRPSRSIERVRW